MNVFKKTFIELIVVLVILLLIAFVANSFVDEQEKMEIVEASLVGQELILEIADDPFSRSVGLSGRDEMDKNHGMIFVYEYEIEGLSFWMKDTLIPLDIVFFDRNFEIVDIIEKVPICEEDPCPEYISDQKAQYVVELNAGWIKENEVEIGDVLNVIAPDQSSP